MNGSISARVVAPPRPGRRPTQNPRPMPSSMKPNAFHCRTRSSPSQSASSTRYSLFTEFDVLRELLDDVLRLVHDFGEDLLRLVTRRELELQLGLLALGDRLRILDRPGECVAHHLDDFRRRLRRQDIGT